MIEWKEDEIEGCELVELEKGILTLRQVNDKWLAIFTAADWQQVRTEFECDKDDAKVKALDWAESQSF